LQHRHTLWISALTIALAATATIALPSLFPPIVFMSGSLAQQVVTVLVLGVTVLLAQFWRVAIRGTRGDVSISMAIDVATMLLLHPYLSGAGSALGTAMYNGFWARADKDHRVARALVRGIITLSAVTLGGWLFRSLRPEDGPIIFAQDWAAIGAGIALRLGIRVVCYPLGMAALQPKPVMEQLRHEWNRLPLFPFLLTTTLGGLAALIWQIQPYAIVLLLGPLTAVWAATREFQRLNELLATLEDKVGDRTLRLAETVRALERRLGESEALHAVDQAMVQALHPEEVLAVIAQESTRVTGGHSALVTLLSEDGQRQFVRSVYGPGMDGFLGVELPTATSWTGLVMRTGEAQISLDPPNDRRLHPGMVKSGNWRVVIEAPLRAKDRVLGVLVVGSQESGPFDDQHIRLLTLLANQAGLILDNARLNAKAREVAIHEERNRLARELHDSVTQVLFSLSLNLEAAGSLIERKPERSAILINRSQEIAAEALAEMRSLIFELRPSALQEKGLAMALTNHVNLFRRRQGIDVSLAIDVEDRLPPDVELCLYRVAQEALSNVARHANAQHVHIDYTFDSSHFIMRISDDGQGFDPESQVGPQSFGMLGMQERLALLNGYLHVVSTLGTGTIVEARIPIHPGGDAA